MTQEYKLLSFLISIKKYKKNSVLLKNAVYQMAKKLEMHPETFKKYLKLAVEREYVILKNEQYRVVSLPVILRDFSQRTGLIFMQHKILKNNCSLKMKDILREIQNFIIIDNIINQQEYAIKKKKEKIKVFHLINRTDKSYFRPDEFSLLKKHAPKADYRCADNIYEHLDYRKTNVTSARHVSQKLGISVMKSNDLLNNLTGYKRNVLVKWVHGASMINFELAKIRFPNATIIPMLFYNKIKICFGSNMEILK